MSLIETDRLPSVLSYDPEIFEHRGLLSVHAVFPHTWHLRSAGGEILSVVESRWNGPLTMRVAAVPARRRVSPGMTAQLTEAALRVGATVIPLDGARAWMPRAPQSEAIDLPSLRADLQTVRDRVRAAARGGLGCGAEGTGATSRASEAFEHAATEHQATPVLVRPAVAGSASPRLALPPQRRIGEGWSVTGNGRPTVARSPTSHSCRTAAPPGMTPPSGRRGEREMSVPGHAATERRATDVMPLSRGGAERFQRRGDATGTWLERGGVKMSSLEEALTREDAGAVFRHAVGLLGFGPGLTPSGDDVLCGLMAGLSVLGRRAGRHRVRCERAVAVLEQGVVAQAGRRTTSLSAGLLRSATRGVVVEPLLQVLETGGSGTPVNGIDEVLMLGHSSGSDMLAGALIAWAVLVRWEEAFGPAMVGSR